MTRFRRSLVLAGILSLTVCLAAKGAKDDSDQPLHNQKVSGLIRDIACPVQNKQSTSRRFNQECALECARKGSPLAILTDDGSMYLPISDAMPDSDQRAKLMPFIGKYVQVVGDVYERKGLHAIVIKQIKEDPSVRLQGDAFQE